jgi:integrase
MAVSLFKSAKLLISSATARDVLLGHATMAMTADTYGHLLPDLENDAAKMAAGELALVAK